MAIDASWPFHHHTGILAVLVIKYRWERFFRIEGVPFTSENGDVHIWVFISERQCAFNGECRKQIWKLTFSYVFIYNSVIINQISENSKLQIHREGLYQCLFISPLSHRQPQGKMLIAEIVIFYLGSLVNLCLTKAPLQSHLARAYSSFSDAKKLSRAVWRENGSPQRNTIGNDLL